MTVTSTHDAQASTVVLRNLSLDCTVAQIESFLQKAGLKAASIDRKVDSTGDFRGTAFVKFESPDHATECVESLAGQGVIEGRRIRFELLKKTTRGRSFSAKEVLEGEVDPKIARVRDFITDFIQSDREECFLPTDLDAEQRKCAHSLAEKFGLLHATKNANGEPVDAASPTGSVVIDKVKAERSVFLSKHRVSPTTSFINKSTVSHASVAFETAAATNAVARMSSSMGPLRPSTGAKTTKTSSLYLGEAVTGGKDLDEVAMIHALQAQAHAEAAKQAILAAKHSKERDGMPKWLSIVEEGTTAQKKSFRSRTSSNLNANAPPFVPAASFMIPAPPGLSA